MWEGTIVFNLPNGISKCIEDTSYVPQLTKNLSSINQLTEQNFKVEFKPPNVLIQKIWFLKLFKKECYIFWLELFNPWLQNVMPRLRKVICAIKTQTCLYVDFNNHGQK